MRVDGLMDICELIAKYKSGSMIGYPDFVVMRKGEIIKNGQELSWQTRKRRLSRRKLWDEGEEGSAG